MELQGGMLDVVIVAYKCYDELERSLQSIEKIEQKNLIDSIIVVDNSPSEQYWGGYRGGRFRPIKVVKNPVNRGFGAAANQGIKMCRAPYVALINPDCIVERAAFEEAVIFLDQKPDVAILGPKIIDPDGTLQGSARSFPNVSTLFFGRSSFLTRVFRNSRFVKRNMPCFSYGDNATQGISVDWVSGAAMFLRREPIEDIGLFDDRFFMYWEDADLCQRARQSGWEVVYFSVPTVIHEVGKSSEHHPWKRELRFHKSALMLVRKMDNSLIPWKTFCAAWVLGMRMHLRLTLLLLERVFGLHGTRKSAES